MLDHCNNLFSFNPDYHRSRTNGTKGDDEFSFWPGEETVSPRYMGNESYPLLPHNHHYSNTSPRSRLQAIADARKELMERVHDMPESSYELSLKDIVDEQLALQHDKNETEGTNVHFNTTSEIETKKKEKKKKKMENTGKSGQISRCGSMEKETLMIKLFVPISLSRKRRGNGSKVSPGSSLDVSNNHVEKSWGLKRFLISRDTKRKSPSNCSSNGSCFLQGCWPVFSINKSKHKSHIEDVYAK